MREFRLGLYDPITDAEPVLFGPAITDRQLAARVMANYRRWAAQQPRITLCIGAFPTAEHVHPADNVAAAGRAAEEITEHGKRRSG
jgi:hypothetical protein